MSKHQPDDDQLEAMIRTLPPRQPSGLLDQRIHNTLTRRAFPWRRLVTAACFGGVCFWFGFAAGQQEIVPPASPNHDSAVKQKNSPTNTPQHNAQGPRFTRIDAQWPIAQAHVLYDIDDGPPVRATIQDTIESTRWFDPENNRDIELTRPVREVSFQRDTPR